MNLKRAKLRPVDNSETGKKVRLRRNFAQHISQPNVFLAGCGRGAMLNAVWLPKAAYILAIDRDPFKLSYLRYHYPQVDSRKGNFDDFNAWPKGVRFQVADFDPYGSPYDAIENFFHQPRWNCPFVAFVTDGTPLWLGRGGFVPRQFRSEQIPRRLSDDGFPKFYFETAVWPWWHDLAGQNRLQVSRTALVWKKGKTVAYYAVQLDF